MSKILQFLLLFSLHQLVILAGRRTPVQCEENKLIRLGKNDAIRCIASIEEMFDVINAAHQKIGHGEEEKH
ncbi:hypothetical protein T01_1199 [Trichinella spiralis]|uniref:Uncharacterized protein n=1 Tax=Trichinella spiralis TaxID=6334 RepID=A0A0V1B682_TRISP|nr:hypothetical protein T01_1199 [Trichinella spiralis]